MPAISGFAQWICSKGTPQTRNPDPDYPKGTHHKSEDAFLIFIFSVTLVVLENPFMRFSTRRWLFTANG